MNDSIFSPKVHEPDVLTEELLDKMLNESKEYMHPTHDGKYLLIVPQQWISKLKQYFNNLHKREP